MTKTSTRYSPEVRERAVRLVLDHQRNYPSQWSAIESIASKIVCSAETLRKWVRRAKCDSGRSSGPTSDELARLKALERENRELRQANEILRKASAFFAQAELDRPMKK
jgi:transposase-like protein